jgi:hypothetical protein
MYTIKLTFDGPKMGIDGIRMKEIVEKTEFKTERALKVWVGKNLSGVLGSGWRVYSVQK